MSRGSILLVDDDHDLLKAAADWLEINDFSVRAFHRPEEAYQQVMREEPDVVVTDIRMPGIDGMTLLTSIVRQRSDVPVILMTAHGDVTLAVKAMKQGAEDFIEKPYDADHLLSILDKAVEKRRMKQEIARLQGLVQAGDRVEIVGDSPAIRDLRHRVQMLAEVDIDVLIIGETGTGKELVAQALHRQSGRAAGPFVAINCAALPESIFESEVFGHAKGAFTGALNDRQGKFEHAAGGTVFLDEIESMPLGLQAKILRVLQERMVERLGENRLRPIDVRIVAAAKSDLSGEIAAGRFREDLFYRLATVDVRIPPLRQRGQDIGLLFGHFASLAARRYGRAERIVSADLLARLGQEEWRGNVRELKARAERFALGFDAGGSEDSGPASGDIPTLPEQVAVFEAEVIRRAIEQSEGNTARAAARLGIPHRTLNEKISRLGLRAR
ncbi:C4-dicarboxylate transport transcriptional regulatory protein (plasmid) [Sinorhizobium sojae CCBAU 05684]|uniref:C4-dicarboxylate transport transcriptional regulatory protein DctD n=1 Tax=Sinorhizobium sojae CCBAU 05684 TaxID=716928 RepID=A0A249PLV0_9HYPH|nr:sigma-54 dependent transcriptional regulator [Sinorhizobium sojae]ASY66695.1 C4-dicarboxylate transport transcriptional regulatory protein [Sinorhizobium sojae CCBAU 05684]